MFSCSKCQQTVLKWQGRCPFCGAWNSLEEQALPAAATLGSRRRSKPLRKPLASAVVSYEEIPATHSERLKVTHQELSQLFGGGLFRGSSYLISGEPGIGKSTLLLTLCGLIEEKILYLSGEETLEQVRDRLKRIIPQPELKRASPNSAPPPLTKRLFFTTHCEVEQLKQEIQRGKYPLVLVDSLQTLYHQELDNLPGSIPQIKCASQTLLTFCKQVNATVLLTGHINKLGDIAGPKLVEHLVDGTVLMYREKGLGGALDLRVLTPLKNRFGSIETSALFSMTERGLRSLTREKLLSTFSLQEKQDEIGSCLFPHFIGKKLLFSEIEALVVPSKLSVPRRSSEGIALSRLNRIIAIMEKYGQVNFSQADVYANVSGGLKGEDLLLDLSLAACLFSSLKNLPLPRRVLFLGEVGLSGRIRAISDFTLRQKEIDTFGSFCYFCPQPQKPTDQNGEQRVVKTMATFLALLEKEFSA